MTQYLAHNDNLKEPVSLQNLEFRGKHIYWLYNVKGILQKRVSCMVVEPTRLKNIWSSNWIISKRTAAKIIQTILKPTGEITSSLSSSSTNNFCSKNKLPLPSWKKVTERFRTIKSKSLDSSILIKMNTTNKRFKYVHWPNEITDAHPRPVACKKHLPASFISFSRATPKKNVVPKHCWLI